MRMSLFRLALIVLLSGTAASAGARSLKYTPPEPAPRPILEVLDDLNRRIRIVEKSIVNERAPAPQAMEDLRGTLADLGRVKPARGSADLLQQYSEAARGLLVNLDRSAQHAYWKEARAGLDQLKDIEKDIRRDYRPGWWARLKYRFKHLF